MNKERKQARELLELEIKLARLKVTAAQIRQEKTRQQRKKQRVDFVPLRKVGRRKPPFPLRAANPVGL